MLRFEHALVAVMTGLDVTVRPGDVIFGDIDGGGVILKERVRDVADAADELGRKEAAARERILAGEKLQSVWAVA